jgi:predicted ester cyclase
MNAIAIDSKHLIEEYFELLSGHAKTEELIDRYVDDPALKEHILQCEAAFPKYELITDQFIAEGDTVAFRGKMRGTHNGSFAGVEATGRQVEADVMLFYRVEGAKIAKFWMVFDAASLMQQLTA